MPEAYLTSVFTRKTKAHNLKFLFHILKLKIRCTWAKGSFFLENLSPLLTLSQRTDQVSLLEIVFTLKTKRLIKAFFYFVALCLLFGQAGEMEVVNCVLETGVVSLLCISVSLSAFLAITMAQRKKYHGSRLILILKVNHRHKSTKMNDIADPVCF